jgi:hypothetical protein
MLARPRTRTLLAVAVLGAALCALAACGGDPTPDEPANGGAVGEAKIQPALLQKDDVPGYLAWTPPERYLSRSENGVCLTALVNVETRPASAPGSKEARVSFSAGDSGPWLSEVVRTYATEADAKDLMAPLQGLTKCGSYTVTDSNGTEYTQSVKVISGTADRFVAEVGLKGNVYTSVENLVVTRIGSTVITLVHSGPAAPPSADTVALADKAVKRARDAGLGFS